MNKVLPILSGMALIIISIGGAYYLYSDHQGNEKERIRNATIECSGLANEVAEKLKGETMIKDTLIVNKIEYNDANQTCSLLTSLRLFSTDLPRELLITEFNIYDGYTGTYIDGISSNDGTLSDDRSNFPSEYSNSYFDEKAKRFTE